MATVTLHGQDVRTVGELPAVGEKLPAFTAVGTDLSEFSSEQLEGKRVVVNLFPSVDTGVCAAQLRTFNKDAASLENTAVLGISNDLPFAQERFCGAEGIDNVATYSAFRTDAGEKLGVLLTEGPLKGLLARAVVVTDEDGTVVYSELVSEIGEEPNYEAALAALM